MSWLWEVALEDIGPAWDQIDDYGRDDAGIRVLCRADRFYLLAKVFGRMDAWHPWLYARCREVERSPNNHLDLWAREHYKSTIITYAGIIQEILNDPEQTICIFSHTKGIARKFFRQIRDELEGNAILKRVFPHILYDNPVREAPRWSEDVGLVVKRKTNPKESTLEAWGLVDGQPTSAHYSLRVYDDVVAPESVTTSDQVKKTTASWELSDNLGAVGGRRWHVGTRYSFADTYHTILERKILSARIYPATHNGLPDGHPVLFDEATWQDKKVTQGPSTIACQMLQNPAAGNQAIFKREWLKFLDIRPATLNVYIICDPAGSKHKSSDNTAMAVIGIDAASNRYLLDGYCHKMSLTERWTALKGLRLVWTRAPGVQGVFVGYEKYGMQSDIEYFEERMRIEKDAWDITELSWPREGGHSKIARVQRLQPHFAAGRFYLPAPVKEETERQKKVKSDGQPFRVFSPIRRVDHEGKLYSLTQMMIDEFLYFPFSVRDDMLDAMSRVEDMEPVPPVVIDMATLEPEAYTDG